jgi:uncharacterized protein (DUF488 family)
MELFTIGHSNHSLEDFIALLKNHGITAIADVRSHPYSRYLPHFTQAALKNSLESAKIRYVFLGQELGARPNNPECYIEGKAVYEKIASTELFEQGIQRLLKGANRYKIALMCAEQDPLTCHRAILVCQHLREFNLEIKHILKNGDLEAHQHLEDRLLIKQGFPEFSEPRRAIQLSLFEPATSYNTPSLRREDCLKKAYKMQGEEIAYVEKAGEKHE